MIIEDMPTKFGVEMETPNWMRVGDYKKGNSQGSAQEVINHYKLFGLTEMNMVFGGFQLGPSDSTLDPDLQKAVDWLKQVSQLAASQLPTMKIMWAVTPTYGWYKTDGSWQTRWWSNVEEIHRQLNSNDHPNIVYMQPYIWEHFGKEAGALTRDAQSQSQEANAFNRHVTLAQQYGHRVWFRGKPIHNPDNWPRFDKFTAGINHKGLPLTEKDWNWRTPPGNVHQYHYRPFANWGVGKGGSDTPVAVGQYMYEAGNWFRYHVIRWIVANMINNGTNMFYFEVQENFFERTDVTAIDWGKSTVQYYHHGAHRALREMLLGIFTCPADGQQFSSEAALNSHWQANHPYVTVELPPLAPGQNQLKMLPQNQQFYAVLTNQGAEPFVGQARILIHNNADTGIIDVEGNAFDVNVNIPAGQSTVVYWPLTIQSIVEDVPTNYIAVKVTGGASSYNPDNLLYGPDDDNWASYKVKLSETASPLPPPPDTAKGTLTVDTTPVKGEVLVAGTSLGQAPITIQLNPGTYTVSFGLVSGYDIPAAQNAQILENQTTTVQGTYTEVTPPVDQGILQLDTTPVKGEIFVDGNSVGVAPQNVELDVGSYELTYGEVEGYDPPDSIPVQVLAGQIVPVIAEYTEQQLPPVPKPTYVPVTVSTIAILTVIGLVALIR